MSGILIVTVASLLDDALGCQLRNILPRRAEMRCQRGAADQYSRAPTSSRWLS